MNILTRLIMVNFILSIDSFLLSNFSTRKKTKLSFYKLPTTETLNTYKKPIQFLGRAAAIGIMTGAGVVSLKNNIYLAQSFFYETLADALPKPAFYWPIALCKHLISNG